MIAKELDLLKFPDELKAAVMQVAAALSEVYQEIPEDNSLPNTQGLQTIGNFVDDEDADADNGSDDAKLKNIGSFVDDEDDTI
jgi:hypothetical protein